MENGISQQSKSISYISRTLRLSQQQVIIIQACCLPTNTQLEIEPGHIKKKKKKKKKKNQQKKYMCKPTQFCHLINDPSPDLAPKKSQGAVGGTNPSKHRSSCYSNWCGRGPAALTGACGGCPGRGASPGPFGHSSLERKQPSERDFLSFPREQRAREGAQGCVGLRPQGGLDGAPLQRLTSPPHGHPKEGNWEHARSSTPTCNRASRRIQGHRRGEHLGRAQRALGEPHPRKSSDPASPDPTRLHERRPKERAFRVGSRESLAPCPPTLVHPQHGRNK